MSGYSFFFLIFSHVLCPINYSELLTAFPFPLPPSLPCWAYIIVTLPASLSLALLLLSAFQTTPWLSLNQHFAYTPNLPKTTTPTSTLLPNMMRAEPSSLLTRYPHFPSGSLLMTCALTALNFLLLVVPWIFGGKEILYKDSLKKEKEIYSKH